MPKSKHSSKSSMSPSASKVKSLPTTEASQTFLKLERIAKADLEYYANFYHLSQEFLSLPIDPQYPAKVSGRVGDLAVSYLLFAPYLLWYQDHHIREIKSTHPDESWQLTNFFRPEFLKRDILESMQTQEDVKRVLNNPDVIETIAESKKEREKEEQPQQIEQEQEQEQEQQIKKESEPSKNDTLKKLFLSLSMAAIFGLLKVSNFANVEVFASLRIFSLSAPWLAFIGFCGTWVAQSLRNTFKRKALEEYQKKDNDMLSVVTTSQRVAFEIGMEATHSTPAMLFSCIRPTAILHLKAYYAGLAAMENQDKNADLINKMHDHHECGNCGLKV